MRRRQRDYTSAARASEPVTQRLKRTFGWAIVNQAKENLLYGGLDDEEERPGFEYNPRRWDFDALQEECRRLNAEAAKKPS